MWKLIKINENTHACVDIMKLQVAFHLFLSGKLLRENRILTSLGLRVCIFGIGILNEVCSALRVNTTLTSLDLSLGNFDDQSIASLGMLLIFIVKN